MDLNRFRLRLNVNKVSDPLMGPILIHEHTKGSKLIQGWVKHTGAKLCWHVWVETKEGTKIDMYAGDFVTEYVYDAGEEYDSDRQALDAWELYQNSPKEYWKSHRMGLRSKLLASLK